MKPRLIHLLGLILFLFSCNKNQDRIVFECYSNDNFLYSFTDLDIEYVDWENQIYKLRKDFNIDSLSNGNISAGTRKEIVNVKLNSKIILVLKVSNYNSSNQYQGNKDGYLHVFQKTTGKIVTQDGRFHIAIRPESKEKIYSDRLYNFWKKQNKLKCIAGDCKNVESPQLEQNLKDQFESEW